MATKALSFDVGDYVVYPKHGVGRVIELQSTDIAGMQLELYVLRFEKEKMTLRVPTNKAESVGMRKLSSDKTMQEALATLKGKPKVKRTMWSRRAQEYEAKINSGDLVSIAEVVRDLFRPDDAPEQSYSERQIFEAASTRLARELGAMEQIDEKAALEKLLDILNKAAVDPPQGEGRGLSGDGCSPDAERGRSGDGPPFFVASRRPHRVLCDIIQLRRLAMRKLLVLAPFSSSPPACSAATRRTTARPAAPRGQRDFQVGAFDKIALAGSHDVVVTVGGAASVRAEGDAEALERLEIRVENGAAQDRHAAAAAAGSGPSWPRHRPRHRAGARPAPRSPARATCASTGSRAQRFAASVAGSGDIEIGALRVAEASFSIAGSGDIRAAGSAEQRERRRSPARAISTSTGSRPADATRLGGRLGRHRVCATAARRSKARSWLGRRQRPRRAPAARSPRSGSGDVRCGG